MPTANPRINVTLSVSLDALVGQLAGYTRVSKSQVLRELLEEAEPALHRVVALMEATAKATQGAKEQLARRLDKNIEDAEDAAAVHLDRLGRMTRDLVSQAEAIRGKRPARRLARAEVGADQATAPPALLASAIVRAVKNPPASNRGVKSTNRRNTTPTRATTKRRSK